jgi:hypothetical protein
MGVFRRTRVAALFTASTLGTLGAAVFAMDVTGTQTPPIGLNLMQTLAPQIEALGRASREEQARQIVFLGDSISISTTGDARPVPQLLRQELDRGAGGERIDLHSLAMLGTGPFDYYFLADVIADAGADDVVIALSLNAFGESFRAMNRKEISGWIATRRLIATAAMPLYWIGLTYDDLLMNALIVRASGFDAWYWLSLEQARLGTARADVSRWLGTHLGLRGPQTFQLARFTHDQMRTRIPGRDRYTKASELKHYGPVLIDLDPGHPVLAMLAAATRHFTERGIRAIVYVNPINVEHLTALGIVPSTALDRSLESIAAAVVGAGGEFVDLHALLPDREFRDAAGHFGGEGATGTQRIARAVAKQILDLQDGRR